MCKSNGKMSFGDFVATPWDYIYLLELSGNRKVKCWGPKLEVVTRRVYNWGHMVGDRYAWYHSKSKPYALGVGQPFWVAQTSADTLNSDGGCKSLKWLEFSLYIKYKVKNIMLSWFCFRTEHTPTSQLSPADKPTKGVYEIRRVHRYTVVTSKCDFVPLCYTCYFITTSSFMTTIIFQTSADVARCRYHSRWKGVSITRASLDLTTSGYLRPPS